MAVLTRTGTRWFTDSAGTYYFQQFLGIIILLFKLLIVNGRYLLCRCAVDFVQHI